MYFVKCLIFTYFLYISTQLTHESEFMKNIIANVLKPGPVRKFVVKDLVWENCGHSDDPGRLYKVNLQHVNKGNIKLSVKAATLVNITAPIKIKLEVWSKVWGKLPCMKGLVGSCTLKDLCSWGETFPACPFKPLRDAHIPCKCPIPKGMYEIKNGKFPIPTSQYADSLSGSYSITAKVTYGQDNHLACYKFNVTLA